ncbi:hypothetical protein FACS1894152_6360 [Bacilli bacterium]|nr:hypothetical protein FACS1894152_6360 [Bacilli bacterium]
MFFKKLELLKARVESKFRAGVKDVDIVVSTKDTETMINIDTVTSTEGTEGAEIIINNSLFTDE